MFTVLNKGTKESHTIKDTELRNTIESMFPDQNKHFYNFIQTKIIKEGYFSNIQFTITHHTYDPVKTKALVNSKLGGFAGVPKNDSPIKHEPNYNQWLLVNTQNGKNCAFNNLSAVARAINVQYAYLYNGVNKHTVFAIGKYRFSRNTTLESTHVFDLLSQVL